ncbi:glycosyltransferase family 2 protein [Rhizobium sp. ARZ01]|uniref:glycosyltransferase n=1 Tax=Rhizobium sp. ARZ01 TaxID=2769313 RepID=UPI001784B026|nr:glycosyltransferase family 2 protein [Rhizobium sp. ARZ01]MBD9374397.1 glycosyltransferase family 2 protein [Rhizobium sp. ARZ01]
MLISVIIPHFNQENQLVVCLSSLHAQRGVSAAIEFIVVDNASRRMPEAVCAAWPDVTLLSETTPGPGPARNAGAAAANGDVLAFIDADCYAHPDWLHHIEQAFTNPDTQILGGEVLVGYAHPSKHTFLEPYEAIYSYRNKEHIEEGFSGTGNLAMHPAVLRHVGPFAGIGVAEDRDWGLRSKALGYRTEYLAQMIVYHPARKSFSELTQKWDRHIAHDFEEKMPGTLGIARWIGRTIAVSGSPLFELRTIMTTPRVAGLTQRITAFGCLCAVRIYRGYAMARILLRGPARDRSDWNR